MRQLLPGEASGQARDALARAGFTGLDIDSSLSGTVNVTTRVRVSPGDADRVLAVLRTLPYFSGSGAGWRSVGRSGRVYEVWVNRRVGMAG
jgi:hypothetical protein